MARFIEVLENNELVAEYCSCNNPNCFDVVNGMAQNRLKPGQRISVSEFEPRG